jgi:hypothetical protein
MIYRADSPSTILESSPVSPGCAGAVYLRPIGAAAWFTRAANASAPKIVALEGMFLRNDLGL